jgi:deoxycytidylate deaminase
MTEASTHAKQAAGQSKAAAKEAAKAAKAAAEPVVETVVEEATVVAEGVNGTVRDAAEAARHVKLSSFANRLNGSNVRFLAPFGLIFVGGVAFHVGRQIRNERKAKVETKVEEVEIVDVEVEVEQPPPGE